jgi:molybdate transport system permease protein
MLSPLLLSLRVASVALLFILPLSILAAGGIARMRSGFWRTLVETILTLPLVLPPSAVGVGLLLILGRGTAGGRFLNDVLHINLLFTWQGATVASAVVAMPLVVRTIETGLSVIGPELTDAARTEGAREFTIFRRILLPLAYRSVLTGATLGFARAFSEFGATMFVAGAVPGETETLPIALWTASDTGDNATAVKLILLAVTVSFVLLFAANRIGAHVASAQGERAR